MGTLRGIVAAVVGCGVWLGAVAVATTAHAVTIDMVTVGNPGNAPDPATGGLYGAVNYEYRIGKYEVTIAQYAEFLNAVAKSDPYALYDPAMASNNRVAGIARSGVTGAYEYSVIGPAGLKRPGADSPGNRPITNITWFDAARFTNWMHNGQGSGSTETGAYSLVGGQLFGTAPARNPGSQFYIPTENEWYKAAYYKSGGTNAGYWKYATQSDTLLGNSIGSGSSQANYRKGFSFSAIFTVTQTNVSQPNQNYLTNVGAFSGSPSAYGTFDQSGNVAEWNDLTGTANSARGHRGGGWASFDFAQASTYRDDPLPFDSGRSSETIGFRLASPVSGPSGVPEIDAAGARLAMVLIVCGLAVLEQRRQGR